MLVRTTACAGPRRLARIAAGFRTIRGRSGVLFERIPTLQSEVHVLPEIAVRPGFCLRRFGSLCACGSFISYRYVCFCPAPVRGRSEPQAVSRCLLRSNQNDNATLARMTVVEITVHRVTGSPSKRPPSATATTGFTYMQLLAMIGLVWRI